MIFQLVNEFKFSIIPLHPMSKHPMVAWKEYTLRHPTTDEIRHWFERGAGEETLNVGIVTGRLSGIVVLDIDGEVGERSLATLGEMPETVSVRTGKGRHLYFRHPGGEVQNFTGKLPGLDLRGDGGYVVAPPSVHENGTAYEWLAHPSDTDIAELPTSLVELIGIERDDETEVVSVADSHVVRRGVRSRTTRRAIDGLIGELAQSEDGTRNDTLNRVAFALGQYVAAGEVDEQWARNALLDQALKNGLPKSECLATIASGLSAGMKEPKAASEPVFAILDSVPEVMDRPIRLLGDKSYGATWVPVQSGDEQQAKPDFELVVFGDGGQFYSERNVEGSRPLSDLPFAVELPHKPMPEKLLSPISLKRWCDQDLPNPEAVFRRLVSCVDAFVSFEHSLADQEGMCELVACWIMGTYAIDAFDVVGYLWPTGERGSGKTQLLNTVSALAYLGRTITSGSSFAAIRDEAHYGATIAFDDCENVRQMENDKRELLLAGNMRGTVISQKEPVGEGEWRTRYVNNFAPRLFSSIGLPDPVLGSRTISIPLVATTDKSKARRSPASQNGWPYGQKLLIDDLWLTAVRYLPDIKQCDQKASDLSDLHARSHDIWRIPLAIAYWLQNVHGVDSLFERITTISVEYQKQVQDVQGIEVVSLLLMALDQLLVGVGEQVSAFETQKIVYCMSELVETFDNVEPDVLTIDAARVGKLIGRLGFSKSPAHGSKRSWLIDRKTLDKVAKSRSVVLPQTEILEMTEEVLGELHF